MALLSHTASQIFSRHGRTLMWGGIVALLLLPAVSMLFTESVNWGVEDFAFAILLLGSAGLLVELAVRRLKSARARATAGVIVAGVVALIWAQAAVGVF